MSTAITSGPRRRTERPAQPAAVVISSAELERLRSSATLASSQEAEQTRARAAAAQAERLEASRARKERMLAMEATRQRTGALAGAERGERAQKNSVLEKAKRALDEGIDDVKHMNQMMLYSKVVTIRDAQVQEKRYIASERAEEDRTLDQMMELERLKALQMYEARESKRVEDQRRGAQVIVEQIRERQAQRLREEEARDQERHFILRQIDALKSEEMEQLKAKKVAAGRLMEEVNAANEAAMTIKEQRLRAERLEDAQVLEYQRQRDERERAREAEEARRAAEKEAEVARLRAMQEKAQDKAAEMDALRAKRATEAAERRAREKEAAERARQSAINAELAEARALQQADKERRLAEQARFERAEFQRIIDVQLQQAEAERQRNDEEQGLRFKHSDDLRTQIAAREEKALQERRDFLEEGNVVRTQLAAERRRLETIKARKIQELQRSGVPEKYWAELARKKISV